MARCACSRSISRPAASTIHWTARSAVRASSCANRSPRCATGSPHAVPKACRSRFSATSIDTWMGVTRCGLCCARPHRWCAPPRAARVRAGAAKPSSTTSCWAALRATGCSPDTLRVADLSRDRRGVAAAPVGPLSGVGALAHPGLTALNAAQAEGGCGMKITGITTKEFRWPRHKPISNGQHTYTHCDLRRGEDRDRRGHHRHRARRWRRASSARPSSA